MWAMTKAASLPKRCAAGRIRWCCSMKSKRPIRTSSTPCCKSWTTDASPTARGQPDVGDEGRRRRLLRFLEEVRVTVGGLGLLVQDRVPGSIEEPDPAPVGIAVALHLQGIGRAEQPEGRAARLFSRRQPE